jgi:tetrahydromethanopterin S-methyltransferase subunit G
MSVAEDMRKVLQDFLAPELRSVHARLDAMDEKLEAHAKVTEARFQEVLVRIDATNGRIDNQLENLPRPRQARGAPGNPPDSLNPKLEDPQVYPITSTDPAGAHF